MSSSSLQVIDSCFVTDSSGCHRYDYWNEQALFDGRQDTGWCTPSRTVARLEYLEVDLGGVRELVSIRLQARPIDDHPGFPRSLTMLTGPPDAPRVLLRATDISIAAGQWWERDVRPTRTRFLRLEVDDVEWRKNGCYFLQFMQLQIVERIVT